jgi:prepilin-type N-terminal cleavage/methylation domain-containing protein
MTQPPRPAHRRPAGLGFRLRQQGRRGFTLVEVMIATMVFTMGILGVYAMMIKSYELVTLARHRDNARAYLQSFSDQFLRLQTTDSISGATITRTLFRTPDMTSFGGDGLHWTDPANNSVTGDGQSELQVQLGDSTSSVVTGHVSRVVQYLDSTGTVSASNSATAAGWMLQGAFTIWYTEPNGKTYTQTLTVARSVR